ncbi:MAG TPA: hypothetical protein DCX07_03030 [Phycisphaerales bacterium]|nr:hypothetical protein [Phycisphaerales bacterium]
MTRRPAGEADKATAAMTTAAATPATHSPRIATWSDSQNVACVDHGSICVGASNMSRNCGTTNASIAPRMAVASTRMVTG